MSSWKIATVVVLAIIPAVPVIAATSLPTAHTTVVSAAATASTPAPAPTSTSTPDDTPWG